MAASGRVATLIRQTLRDPQLPLATTTWASVMQRNPCRPSGGATRPTRQIRRPRSPCSTANAGVTPTLCQRLAGAARHAARRLADDPGSR